MAVQRWLIQQGCLRTSVVQPAFGQKASEAVKRFQRDNGLKVNGFVDLPTQRLMEADPAFLALVEAEPDPET